MTEPFVSVLLPVRNDAEYITAALESILAQDYPRDRMEILVADGLSTDGTSQILADFQEQHREVSIRLLRNPGKIVAIGLNIATRQARGEIIIRVDGHCVIAADYVRKCVEHIQEHGVAGVGGPMESIGGTQVAKAIAVGMSSPFGVGNSAFRTTTGKNMLTDTIPFPAYTREIIQHAGLYDEELVRNQDDEYNYRIRALGGKLLLADDVRSTYFSRSSLKAVWRQYFEYGLWKVRVLQKHPLQMSLRQFIPPTFVLALIFSALLALLPFIGLRSSVSSSLSPALGLPSSVFGLPSFVFLILSCLAPLLYLLANLAASLLTASKRGWNNLPLLPPIFAILHVSYGLGFLLGLVRFVNRWGDRVGQVPEWSAARAPRVEPLVHVYWPASERAGARLLKRLFDILASSFGLLVLSPIFGLLAVLIKRESPGPAFYPGTRIGRDGKPFNILKFRTMYDHPESYAGPRLTAEDDPRITPLGRWLRDTKLNELPQLWNVLKGEMSMVGPRPEVPEIVRTWPTEARAEVLSMRPGITSPASVIFRNEEKLLHTDNLLEDYLKDVMPDKLRLDQLYVRNHTVLGDLDVIFTTLAALLPQLRESRFAPEMLYNGGLSRFVRRYVAWYVIDSLVAFAAISLAALVWRLDGPLELGFGRAVLLAVLMALVFGLVNAARGLGRLSWQHARPAYAFDVFLSSIITTFGMAALNLLWPEQGRFFPRAMVIIAGLLAFLGFLAVRYRERLLTGLAWRWISSRQGEDALRERVLIVGAGQGGLLASWLVQHSRLASHFTIVGMVDDDPRKDGMTIDGHRVFGLTRRIPELVEKMDVGVILFAIEKIRTEDQERILDLCRQSPARLVLVPDLLEIFRERMSYDEPHKEPPTGVSIEADHPYPASEIPTRPGPRPGLASEITSQDDTSHPTT